MCGLLKPEQLWLHHHHSASLKLLENAVLNHTPGDVNHPDGRHRHVFYIAKVNEIFLQLVILLFIPPITPFLLSTFAPERYPGDDYI
jgi:hypothetical protein